MDRQPGRPQRLGRARTASESHRPESGGVGPFRGRTMTVPTPAAKVSEMGTVARSLELYLLGPMEVRLDGAVVPVTAAQQRTVLAALAVFAGSPVTSDALCEALWPDRQPATARTSLHNTIRRLRSLLEVASPTSAQLLLTDPLGYRLAVQPEQVDVHRFTALADQAREAVSRSDFLAADGLYREALELWRGPVPLELLDSGAPGAVLGVAKERRDLAVEEAAAVARQLDTPERALELLTPLLARQPLRESAWALRMLALHDAGRTADALEAFGRARQLLADELGADPGRLLHDAHAEVLRLPETSRPPLALSGVHPIPAQLPPLRVALVGRDQELAALDALADSPAGLAGVCAVSGPAGVGKTSLVVDWARRVTEHFPDGQLFVDLRGFDPEASPVSAARVLADFLVALGVPPDDLPTEPDSALALYRTLTSQRRLLVILDNARDADHVRPLLPGGQGSLALVTSRRDLSALVVTHGARQLVLGHLDADSSRAILAQHIGAARSIAEARALDILVQRCGGLPLALALAGARIGGTHGVTASEMTDRMRQASSLDVLSLGDPRTDLRTVLSLSLEPLSSSALHAFALLGVYPGAQPSVAILASMAEGGVSTQRAAVDELARAHLVQAVPGGRVAVHDLVRDRAREVAMARLSTRQREEALARFVDHVLHSAHAATRRLFSSELPFGLPVPLPGVQPETPENIDAAQSWLQAAHDEILLAVEHAGAPGGPAGHAWKIARTVNGFLWDWCRWSDMEYLHRVGLETATREGDRQGMADAHHGLGDAAAGLGRWDLARHHLDTAAELFVSTGDPVGEIDAITTLGRALEQQGDWAAAIETTQRALDGARRHSLTEAQAIALNNLGWLYSQIGDFQAALEHAEQAVELYRGLDDERGLTYTLDTAGRAYEGLGDLASAVRAYAEAVAVAVRRGPSFNLAENLTHLGDACHANGDLRAALDAWSRAAAVLHDIGHPRAEVLSTRVRDLSVSAVQAR